MASFLLFQDVWLSSFFQSWHRPLVQGRIKAEDVTHGFKALLFPLLGENMCLGGYLLRIDSLQFWECPIFSCKLL